MKKWTIAAAAIVILAVVFVGVSYVTLGNRIGTAQRQIEALKSDVSKLQGSSGQYVPATSSAVSSLTMVDLITAIQPIIVRVDVTGSNFQASGSAIIIRSDGYLLTNQHVIDGATSIVVTVSGDQQFPASVSSSDANLDLAILKIGGSPAGLQRGDVGFGLRHSHRGSSRCCWISVGTQPAGSGFLHSGDNFRHTHSQWSEIRSNRRPNKSGQQWGGIDRTDFRQSHRHHHSRLSPQGPGYRGNRSRHTD